MKTEGLICYNFFKKVLEPIDTKLKVWGWIKHFLKSKDLFDTTLKIEGLTCNLTKKNILLRVEQYVRLIITF